MASEIIKVDNHNIINPEDPDKLFQEINLIRIEGCYFNFSRKQDSIFSLASDNFCSAFPFK